MTEDFIIFFKDQTVISIFVLKKKLTTQEDDNIE